MELEREVSPVARRGRKRGHEEMEGSTTAFTNINQELPNSADFSTIHQELPNSADITERDTLVLFESHHSPYFQQPQQAASHPPYFQQPQQTASNVEATFNPVISAGPGGVNADNLEPAPPTLLAELQAVFAGELSQKDVDSKLRNSSVKRWVAQLPKVNNVIFKPEVSLVLTEAKFWSYLIQSRGKVNPEKCWRCAEGHGPYVGKECISIISNEPFLKGTCGICAWNSNNSHCTWNVTHDVGKQPPQFRKQVMAAKNKCDCARVKFGMPPADDSVPQYFEVGSVLLQYPGTMRLEDAVARLVGATQGQVEATPPN